LLRVIPVSDIGKPDAVVGQRGTMKRHSILLTPCVIIALLQLTSCGHDVYQRKYADVDLPQVPTVACEDYFLPTELMIHKDGSLSFGGKAVGFDEFDSAVAAMGKKTMEVDVTTDGIDRIVTTNVLAQVAFMIAADKNAPLSQVWRAARTWRRYGGNRFHIVVKDSSNLGLGAVTCFFLPSDGGAGTKDQFVVDLETTNIEVSVRNHDFAVNGTAMDRSNMRKRFEDMISDLNSKGMNASRSVRMVIRFDSTVPFAHLADALTMSKELHIDGGIFVVQR
jgi:biopolymer transport protein ExbD